MAQMSEWSRTDKLTLFSIVITLFGAIAAWLVVPEFRHTFNLPKEYPTNAANNSSNNRASESAKNLNGSPEITPKSSTPTETKNDGVSFAAQLLGTWVHDNNVKIT